MTRRTSLLVGAALIVAMMLTVATSAFATPALSLSAKRASVTYPQPDWLIVRAGDGDVAVPTTVTVQYRPIGTDTWATLRIVPASRAAEGTFTVTVPPYRLKMITGFRAIAEGLESDVVTVSVKARLSAASAPAKVREGRKLTIHGKIWPRHAVGSKPVTVRVWKWEDGAWAEKGSLHPAIVSKQAYSSKWQIKIKAITAEKGTYRLRVYHEDTRHEASMSKYSYIRVR